MTYNYDSCGLGHLRRSFAISKFIALNVPGSNVLSVTDSCLAQNFFEPEIDSHDFIKIPSIKKSGVDTYNPRFLKMPDDHIFRIREDIIERTVLSYQPDVIIIDKNPRGISDEIKSALERLKEQHSSTKIILGLRDILDDPEVVKVQWRKESFVSWISRIYDAIWIWGEPEVFDAVKAYEFSDSITAMTKYMGYIPPDPMHGDTQRLRKKVGITTTQERLLLMTAGGGGDALPLFQEAIRGLRAADETHIKCLIVSGPLMSESDFFQLKRSILPIQERVRLVRFLKNFGDWLRSSDAVISMGGYNTMTELASIGKPSLIIPRTYPQLEQYNRAKTFARHGWCRAVGLDEDIKSSVTNFCQLLASDRLEHSLTTLHCRAFSSLMEEIRKIEKTLNSSRTKPVKSSKNRS